MCVRVFAHLNSWVIRWMCARVWARLCVGVCAIVRTCVCVYDLVCMRMCLCMYAIACACVFTCERVCVNAVRVHVTGDQDVGDYRRAVCRLLGPESH